MAKQAKEVMKKKSAQNPVVAYLVAKPWRACGVLAGLFILGVGLLWQAGVFSSELPQPEEYTTSGILQDGTEYELTIHSVARKSLPWKQLWQVEEFFGGESDKKPEMVIETINLKLGDRQVEFPEEMVLGLGNVQLPQGVAMTQYGNDTMLVVQGGQEAAAYMARFKMVQGSFYEREVRQRSHGISVTRYQPEIALKPVKFDPSTVLDATGSKQP